MSSWLVMIFCAVSFFIGCSWMYFGPALLDRLFRYIGYKPEDE